MLIWWQTTRKVKVAVHRKELGFLIPIWTNTEKDQTGHASTSCGNAPNSVRVSGHGIKHSTAHCLLCPNSKSCLPWMSGYLWEIGEIFDTTFTQKWPSMGGTVYVKRKPERAMQNCGSFCGNMIWGSSAHCDAAHVNYITTLSDISLVSKRILVVTYRNTNKKGCFECVRSIKGPIVEQNEDDDLHSIFAEVIQSNWNDLLATRKTCRYCSAVND